VKCIRFSALLAAACFVSLTSCAAPRAVLWDGSSVAAGHVEGHLGMVGTLPTATMASLASGTLEGIKVLANGRDSLSDSVMLRKGARTLVAAGLDMPGANFVASVHVGIGGGAELGYRREGGANAFALRYQFLSAEDGGWNAGTAIQYSSQDYDIPITAISDVQKVLGYSFSRQDISVPVVFSKPFGVEGKYGSAGLGVVGAWTRTEYGFDPHGMYRLWGDTVEVLEKLPHQKTSFFSYGGMGFVRLGYKHAWLMVGLNVIYQDYGTYRLPATDPISLSGLTFLPSAGLEIRI